MSTRAARAAVGGLAVAALVLAATQALLEPAAASIDCARIAGESAARNATVAHNGPRRITVVGDSYAQGYGLGDAGDSWPSYLPGTVTVRSLGGTGFVASPCGPHDAYADRARNLPSTGLVVVEGGLNDVLASDEQIRTGLTNVVRSVGANRLVIVGPANAPKWSKQAARVDRILAAACAELGVGYVSTYDLDLNYAAGGIHLVGVADHIAFAEKVTSALS